MPEAGAGLASAAAAAVEEAGLVMFTPAEQIDLALEGRLPDRAGMRAAAIEARRGRGRPKGSRNKKTDELRAYLLSRYRHPLETLAAVQAQDPDTLAAELGCTEPEALGYIIKAADALAPYLAGKMPVEVQFSGKGHMTWVIGAPPAAAGVPGQTIEGGAIAGPSAASFLRFALPEVAEKLGISDADAEASE